MNLFEYDEFKNLESESNDERKLKLLLETIKDIRILEIKPTKRGYARLTENAEKITDVLWELGLTVDSISPFMFNSPTLWDELIKGVKNVGIPELNSDEINSTTLIGIFILKNRLPKIFLQANISSFKELLAFIALKEYMNQDLVTTFVSIYYPEFYDIDFK